MLKAALILVAAVALTGCTIAQRDDRGVVIASRPGQTYDASGASCNYSISPEVRLGICPHP